MQLHALQGGVGEESDSGQGGCSKGFIEEEGRRRGGGVDGGGVVGD
jgi:hypothetical protein